MLKHFLVTKALDVPKNAKSLLETHLFSVESATTILNLATKTWKWGQNFPGDHVEGASSAQFGDGFLVVGGYDNYNYVYLDTIYRVGRKFPKMWQDCLIFPFQFDEASYGWVKMPQRLSLARRDFALVALPKGHGMCN